MAKKRKLVIQKVADYFNINHPAVSVDVLINLKIYDDVLIQACRTLFGVDSTAKRYLISKAFQRNTGNICDLIHSNCNKLKKRSQKGSNFLDDFIAALKSTRISTEEFEKTASYFTNSCTYSRICASMRIKNSPRNRLKLKMTVNRNKRYIKNAVNSVGRTSTPTEADETFEILDISCIRSKRQSTDVLGEVDGNEKTISTGSLKSLGPEHDVNSIDIKSDISQSLEVLPDEILKIDRNNTVSEFTLPLNSKNEKNKNWNRPSYKNCTLKEGTFSLALEELNVLKQEGNTLKRGYYPYVIRNKMKSVNNTCYVNFKQVRYIKLSDSFKLYAYCAHKHCKYFIFVLKNVSQECPYFQVDLYSSSLNYNHLNILTGHLKGIERSLTRNKLGHMKPFKYRENTILTVPQKSIRRGNLECIKSESVIRKVRSERLSLLDRHEDDLIDMVMMHRQNFDYIQSVGVPFFVYIWSKQQLDLILSESNTGLPILYLDATGKIIRKPSPKNKRIYYYAGVIHMAKNRRVCPVVEMVSSTHDGGSIGVWLAKFKIYCLLNLKKWPVFSKIVTDFSYALINAVCEFWNNVPLIQYLRLTFDYVKNRKRDNLKNLIAIHICCCHFLKIIASDINPLYDTATKGTMKEIMASAFNISNLSKFKIWFKNICIILKSKTNTPQVKSALKELISVCLHSDSFEVDQHQHTIEKQTEKPNEPLYKSSPYYQYFLNIYEKIKFQGELDLGEENKYYCPDFLAIILQKYIPLLPLWSGILLNEGRLSNAPVERWFGITKNLILDGVMNQKCSRVVRKIRSHVLSIHKENELNIPRKRCTTGANLSTEGILSTEKWKKKKATPITYFKKSRLLALNTNNTKSVNMTDDSFMKCTYCQRGKLDETVAWVQCDRCKGWIHQVCVSDITNSYSGDFICKFCAISEKTGKKSVTHKVDKLSILCKEYFIQNMKLSEDELGKIERLTVNQRLSNSWYVERSKRLTASMFGTLCKSRSNTLGKKVIRITKPELNSISNLESVKHGNESEEKARQLYKMTHPNFNVKNSGLIIHKKYQFLACSPDGLVNDDGIVEIKCPYSIKDLNPKIAIRQGKLAYFSKLGYLKTGHDYNYQIQGQLEITNKSWCDLLIYTSKGLYERRIYRDKKLWESMYSKLEDIYYHYLLPQIVDPKVICERRDYNINFEQTTTCLNIWDNGLVKDIKYYRTLQINMGYTIANYSYIDYFVKEITFDDFNSLSPKKWLTNFVVDICLHLINHNNGNNYQIIPTEIAANILNAVFSGSERITISKSKIVIPILRNNHFCIAIVDFEKHTFDFINPQTVSREEGTLYLNQFCKYIKYYNQHQKNKISISKWTLSTRNHIFQSDAYNCGVFIIYFFRQIVTGKSLCDYYDMDTFRDELKLFLLENSDSMKDNCLLCGINKSRCGPSVCCNQCKRICHLRCLTENLSKYIKDSGKCYLCTTYSSK